MTKTNTDMVGLVGLEGFNGMEITIGLPKDKINLPEGIDCLVTIDKNRGQAQNYKPSSIKLKHSQHSNITIEVKDLSM